MEEEQDKLPDYLRYLPNRYQSSQERREKYWLVKSLGLNSYQAARYRDFRLSTIERKLGIELGLTRGSNSLQKNRDRLHSLREGVTGPSL